MRKLDPLTVSMSPPDATIALLSGAGGVSSAFSVPPFQFQQLEKPNIHTVLSSFDVLGPHTFTVAWTSARFRKDNPELYGAFLDAVKEATAIIAADPKGTAQSWINDSGSKLPLEMVTKVVTGPGVEWTMTPAATMKFAKFMYKVGTTKHEPASWKEMFFPEIARPQRQLKRSAQATSTGEKSMPPTASRKFPVLSTKRLTLRAATPKDVPAFQALLAAPDVTRFSNWPDNVSTTQVERSHALDVEGPWFRQGLRLDHRDRGLEGAGRRDPLQQL